MSGPEKKAAQPSAPSVRARQLGCAVLEVLGGLRSPQEASDALGLTIQRYYTLEARAVEGLVSALEPRRRGGGRRKSVSRELEELRAEIDRLQHELRRSQALVRVAQRTVKLPPAPTRKDREKAKRSAKAKGKRGPRRPAVRARKLAEKVRPPSEPSDASEQREAS